MGDKKKRRIPKHVAGVKLPKELRRAGEELLARVDTPGNRQALATGLTMATAAIAKLATEQLQRPPRPPQPPQPPVPPTPPEAAAAPAPPAPPAPPPPSAQARREEIGEALAGVAQTMIERLFSDRPAPPVPPVPPAGKPH